MEHMGQTMERIVCQEKEVDHILKVMGIFFFLMEALEWHDEIHILQHFF